MTGTVKLADGAFNKALRYVTNREPKCGLSAAMKIIGPDNAAALKKALSESSSVFSASQISKALKIVGQDVSESSIRRCRRNKCECWTR